MIILQANGLTKSFVGETLLENISFEVQTGERIALVGRNGAGKSTLLKMVLGKITTDAGSVMIPKQIKIGYLDQHTGLDSTRTIWDELMLVFTDLKQMEQQLTNLSVKMGEVTGEQLEKIMHQYDQLQQEFADRGGYQYEKEARTVLHGFGFDESWHHKAITSLSGGQKTRVAFVRLLLTKPDLLILDEPTNHLDIETVTWLETYLQNYPGALLLVSHDRYFLDRIVTQVFELSRTKMRKYHGNYSKYVEQKSGDYERQLKQYEAQQKEIARLQDFVDRNIARATSSSAAKNKQKSIARMDLIEAPQQAEKSAHFRLQAKKQTGKDVLALDGLAIGYPDKPLAKNITCHFYRGDRIAIVGPNGIGKTTLLKTLLKQLPLLAGTVKEGYHLEYGYFDQEDESLNPKKTILDEVWDEFPLLPQAVVRTALGNVLFTGDDVKKTISELSGGEKAKVKLAKIFLQAPNVLLMDEPTNHLDLESKAVLESALKGYDGTVLFVSHDRYFMNELATKVLALSSDEALMYHGNYEYYLEKQAENQLEQTIETVEPTENQLSYAQLKNKRREQQQLQRQIEAIEQTIAQLETEIELKQAQMLTPEVYQDYERATSLQSEIDAQQEELFTAMETWEQLLAAE
ncbi:MAG: ABC-F family ATP-binding cassette domain-containing protein [Culicoidibacterales bacterium]